MSNIHRPTPGRVRMAALMCLTTIASTKELKTLVRETYQ